MVKKNDADTPIVDLDAILAKREEEVGSRDRWPASAYGRVWWLMDPKLADDDWLDELDAIVDDGGGPVDIAAHYLGDQWEEFKKAGGRATDVLAMVEQYAEYQAALDGDDSGKARRSSTFSNRSQRRRRRR